MDKSPQTHTIHEDGSITFVGEVTDEERRQAYADAARQRAAATDVDPAELVALANESADLTTERAHATDTIQETK